MGADETDLKVFIRIHPRFSEFIFGP